MELLEIAISVLQAAKELTEQEHYFFFVDAAELAGIIQKHTEIETDTEIVGCMKDTLRTAANAISIVRSAAKFAT